MVVHLGHANSTWTPWHMDVVIVYTRQSVRWYPRGGSGLGASARISARMRWIPSTAVTIEVMAATEDSSRGNGHPNDGRLPSRR
jgi:hypothetical protein